MATDIEPEKGIGILIKHIGSKNMYAGDVLTFRILRMSTLGYGTYTFSIETF